MTLTNEQVVRLAEAIGALDGQSVTQLVEGKPVVVQRIPRLTHNGRWALARNAGRLESAIADLKRARSALVKEHAEGQGAIGPQHPNFNAFAEDFERLNQQAVEIELDKIAAADLRPEENENTGNGIPIGVLRALAPLISTN
jgi:hypothetical protein